jgi:metal-responsive CopG/Arc/MetJ family transcriptional regulator
MDNRKDVTVSLPAEWVEEIDNNLDYGDSRSGWIREAVRQRLEAEGYFGDEEADTPNPTPQTAD